MAQLLFPSDPLAPRKVEPDFEEELDAARAAGFQAWGELTNVQRELPLEELRRVAARAPSRFFSMDVAFTESGGWIVVERGDGQVSGLPSPSLAEPFYQALAVRCRG